MKFREKKEAGEKKREKEGGSREKKTPCYVAKYPIWWFA